ncbi:FkbM family methyltransferase [Algoriphagus limi]|uniref:FkbM family methyltransferase n=1 Tax=Algoriphagus limi TaxID=2975273 RepID=A0ABT2G1L9_9BACT|nr:FkbM family methyltransferase [Algoriphagus limi]MCS5489170.1 FkbM family methyltransferase [Algoriphagus limi]
MNSTCLNDYEFKIFSQFGDDGIIQYLIKHLSIKNKTFIEFGVENYLESTTRFLMMNNLWSGFVMDGSKSFMDSLQNQPWYWKHQLLHKAAFITRENINGLIEESGFSDIGLLHIDIDGNDYHVLEAMDFTKLNPSILIMEYNSVFGMDRAISTPYRPDFYRTKAHFSNLYFGASLPALDYLADKKGYSLIGGNLAGNNAYFVRKDLLNSKISACSLEEAFQESQFMESRDENSQLTFLRGEQRIKEIQGLDVINVISGQLEKL